MSDKIKPSEVSQVLLEQLKGISNGEQFDEVGTVLQVSDGVARIYGLRNAEANELLEFENGTMAIVMNLEEDNVGCVLLGSTDGLRPDELPRRDGEGEHQIALVGHEVLIEPVDHQHEGQNAPAEHRLGEEQHAQHRQYPHELAGRLLRQHLKAAHQRRRQQHHQIYRQQDAPRGAELVLDQLTQHSGTPHGTAHPRCSRAPDGSRRRWTGA